MNDKLNLPDPDELISKYCVPCNTNKNLQTNITYNDISQTSYLKGDDKVIMTFYDNIESDNTEFDYGDYCPIKPKNMESDPYVINQSWLRSKLLSDNMTDDFKHQRKTLESLFKHCSNNDGSSSNHLKDYLERSFINKSHKKLKDNREMIKRKYEETLPKIISAHLTSVLYKRIKMNHFQKIHETKLHRHFEHRQTPHNKINKHPFYGLPAKINGDKSRYEEYLVFLLLNPFHDYKSTFNIFPRNFIISQYQYSEDELLTDKKDEPMKLTYNSYLHKVVVSGIIDPLNSHTMTYMRDLLNYKIHFNETKYPDLAKLIQMSLYASFLSVLTEKSLINFEIYSLFFFFYFFYFFYFFSIFYLYLLFLLLLLFLHFLHFLHFLQFLHFLLYFLLHMLLLLLLHLLL